LIDLRVLSVPLKVDELDDSLAAKNMVASPGPFDEAEMQKKAPELVERDVCVRGSSKNSVEGVLVLPHS